MAAKMMVGSRKVVERRSMEKRKGTEVASR